MISCDRVRELASGYVLGALEPEEMAAVEEHLESCHDAHSEVAELGGVLPYLAVAPEPLEPPAWLRDSVMAAVRADLTVRRRPAAMPTVLVSATEPESASPGVLESSDGKIVSLVAMRSRRHRLPIWLARTAAAVAVVAITVGRSSAAPCGIGFQPGVASAAAVSASVKAQQFE